MVDDDEIYHDIIQQIIEPYHYKLIHAYNGGEGIERFNQEENIDLILSDIMMPKVGGIELLENIRSSNRADTPVIMMTSHVKNEYILQALRLGASDFIGKKFNEISLLNSINRQINKITQKKKESR